jgi:hypothetical protein
MTEKIEKKSRCGRRLITEDLPDIYKEISEKVILLEKDENAIEETSAKGYESTGYRYQYLCNILNEVIGSNHWNITSTIMESQVDGIRHRVCMKIVFEIGNWMPGSLEGNTASFFDVLDHKEHFGEGVNKAYGDAAKGAVTNGFKKCIGLAGIGNRAFTGELARAFGKEVDFSDEEVEDGEPRPKRQSKKEEGIVSGFYDFKNPYGKKKCHLSGLPMDDVQMEFCKKEGIRPTSPKRLETFKGNLSSIKLTEVEKHAANSQ